MGRLSNKKIHKPTTDLKNYFWIISGIPKIGKTSLFAKIIKEKYGDLKKGLLIAFETGYEALNVFAEDVTDWDDFEDLVDDLIENKDEYDIEFLGLDTLDIMWDFAQDKVIEEWNRENPNLYTQDINSVGMKKPGGKGFGLGYNRAAKKIKNATAKLRRAGYGLMGITHSKEEHKEEKSGLEYDQLTLSLSGSARKVFLNDASMVVFITSEKVQEGDELITKRIMHLRNDSYIEGGCRFENIPEKIEYSPKKLLEVFEEAVKSVGEYTEEKRKAQYREPKKTLADIKKEIINIATKKSNEGKKKEIINAIAENNDGNQNPNAINDIVTAQTILEAVKKV